MWKNKRKRKSLLECPWQNVSRALTLLEVLIAMAILAMVLSMVYTILLSTLSAKELVESRTHTDRIANRLITLMTQDIQSAYIYAMEGNFFSGKPDRIDFICNTDSLMSLPDCRSDLCEVGYFLAPEAGAFKLMRREDFFVDEEPLGGGYGIKLYDRVASLKLEYIGKDGKIKSFWNGKEEKGIPVAVRVVLGLYTAPRDADPTTLRESVRHFSTCVPIMVSPDILEPEKQEEEKKEEKKD